MSRHCPSGFVNSVNWSRRSRLQARGVAMSDECQHKTICWDCGAMTTGYAALTARAEAAEQQAARLTAALIEADEALVSVINYRDANGVHPLDGPITIAVDRAISRSRAALATSQPAPAVETNDGLCSHCGCCSGFDQPDGSVVCIGRCDVPEQHAELARGGQADGEG